MQYLTLIQFQFKFSRYRLAQQQLKEMKKKGLKEATQLYHVSSSPVHDTLLETSASPTNSPTPSLPLPPQDDANDSNFCVAAPFIEQLSKNMRVLPEKVSPRVELALGPPKSANGGSSRWHDRTAHWVEMVERSGLAGVRGGDVGEGQPRINFNHRNPNFRRTSSFNQTLQSSHSRPFRERSMTQVSFPALVLTFMSHFLGVVGVAVGYRNFYFFFFRWAPELCLKQVGPKEGGKDIRTNPTPFQSMGPQTGPNIQPSRDITRSSICWRKMLSHTKVNLNIQEPTQTAHTYLRNLPDVEVKMGCPGSEVHLQGFPILFGQTSLEWIGQSALNTTGIVEARHRSRGTFWPGN